MRDDLVAAVELLTERNVIAFMSTNHLDPDMGAEIFVLEPRITALTHGGEGSTMSTTSRSAQAIASSNLGAARAGNET